MRVVAGATDARTLEQASPRDVGAEGRPMYSEPRSLWKITPRAGRVSAACVRTRQVTAAVRRRVSVQASTRREYWSITTAR